MTRWIAGGVVGIRAGWFIRKTPDANTVQGSGPGRALALLLIALAIGGASCTARDVTQWPVAEVVYDSIGATPDGTVATSYAVLEADSSRILVFEKTALDVFAQDGTLLGRLGREGSGPGEFREMTRVGMISDSLFWIWDSRMNRLTLFDLDRMALSLDSYQAEAVKIDGRTVSWSGPVSRSTDGSSINVGLRVEGAPFKLDAPDDGAESVLGWRPAAEGRPDVLAYLRGSRRCLVKRDGKVHDVPQCKREFWTIDAAGARLAVAVPHDDVDDTYQFVLMASSGDTLYAVSLELEGRAWSVTDSAGGATAPTTDQVALGLVPERFAVVRRLELGSDGTLWIAGILVSGRRVWHVVSPEGKPMAKVWLPEDDWVQAVSRTGALVTRDLENGQVVLYRLRLVE